MAKKELEEKEYKFFHTGQICELCGEELTKDELDYIEKFGGPKICEHCRNIQNKMDKEWNTGMRK